MPVLLDAFLDAVAPVAGVWVDATFGAGGYTRGLIEAGADRVLAIDCDPNAIEIPADDGRVALLRGWFADFASRPEILDARPLDGVVFDLGMSSMQVDTAARGFSFNKDGPLDMRMSGNGRTAADIVNEASEKQLADLIFHFGGEPRARKIAKRIVKHRETEPITTTKQLADILCACMVAKRKRIHPATRCFQAIRIAVNNELDQLVRGLNSAEQALRAGGYLAVVSFHSLEDRIVKHFMRGIGPENRHQPIQVAADRPFTELTRRAVRADADEIRRNPRSRSARLRIAQRTAASPLGTGGLQDCHWHSIAGGT